MEQKEIKVAPESKAVSFVEALKQIRSQEKRKFVQSVDVIINLQKIDPRKEAINAFVALPYPAEKRLCAFLTKKSDLIDTIVKEQFELYKDNKQIKKLAKRYDAFIAVAPLMGAVATKFGRVLGPVGKMPTPQGGVIMQENDENLKNMIKKMSESSRLRIKEKSIKFSIAKEDLEDKKIIENYEAFIKTILDILPNKKDNIKNISVKLTMSAPVEVAK